MDARELTKYTRDLENRVIELEKTVEYLEQDNTKIRRILEDLRIDLQMVEHGVRR